MEPGRTLYVPGPVLREGANEVWVLELEEAGEPFVGLGPGAPVRTGAPGGCCGVSGVRGPRRPMRWWRRRPTPGCTRRGNRAVRSPGPS
ncbi:hypothetical protein [Streptomyces sp. NPDC014623]|uniref:hypothetical protein n=1 Tax=Streptomyces sp. NPDC014623 TaxID=3364875 RepID=UPI0036FEC452